MPLLSRFKKSKSTDEDQGEDLEDLGAGEEEGLLMATADQPRAPEAGKEAGGGPGAEATAQDEAAQPPEGEAAAPDASEAAEPTASADPLAALEGEQREAGEEASEGEGASGEGDAAPDDDPLAAFRSSADESESSGLTKHIEDVPIADLVAELREVRNMLPPTPPEAGGVEE